MAQEKINLQSWTEEQLSAELATLETSLNTLQFDNAIRGVADTSQFSKTRKQVARILTELRRRELAAYSADELAMRSKIRARRSRAKKA